MQKFKIVETPQLSKAEKRRKKYPYKYNKDDPAYDAFALRDVKLPLTDFDTFMHLLKGVLGSGILAMPYAFSKAGLFFGLGASIVVGALITYGIHILINVSHILSHREKVPKMTYPEVVELCFSSCAAEKARKYAKLMRSMVNAFLLMDMLGCCIIYIVFVSKNAKQLIEHFSDVHLSLRIWIWIFTIPILLVCLIRNLKYLVPFSTIANICLFVGLCITAQKLMTDMPDISERENVGPVLEWPIFLGTIFFALECIAVVMSLENDMKNPTHLIGCPSVLNFAMALVIVLYILLGFFGYWHYGNDVQGSITLNLDVNDLGAQLVKGLVSFAVFCSYPLYYYTPLHIMWNSLKHKLEEKKVLNYEYAFRILLVLFISLVAFAIPNLGPLISLVGAVCISFLGIILPMLMELTCYYADPGYGTLQWRLWKCILLILFGIFVLITGSIQSISDIIKELQTGSFE